MKKSVMIVAALLMGAAVLAFAFDLKPKVNDLDGSGGFASRLAGPFFSSAAVAAIFEAEDVVLRPSRIIKGLLCRGVPMIPR